MIELMLSAATTSTGCEGSACNVCPASRISGTALAQPTPVTWYLSVLGRIP